YGLTPADMEWVARHGSMTYQDPLIVELMIRYLRPEVTTRELTMNPYLMAGWVGFLITGLNMFPISQLDGGHISYALFGKGAHLVARLVVIGALLFFFLSDNYMWAPMLIL